MGLTESYYDGSGTIATIIIDKDLLTEKDAKIEKLEMALRMLWEDLVEVDRYYLSNGVAEAVADALEMPITDEYFAGACVWENQPANNALLAD